MRRGAEAVTLAARAAQLSGARDPALLDTLAAAYAEAGRFPEAVSAARRARDLATQQHQPAQAESIQTRLALYEAGTPFRETRQMAPARNDGPLDSGFEPAAAGFAPSRTLDD